MSLLNPVTDKFRVQFIGAFTDDICEKYNNYLFSKNAPLKDIEESVYETIVGCTTPGFNLPTSTITGVSNAASGSRPQTPSNTNIIVPQNAPMLETYESTTFTLNCRNNTLNYMFFYEMFYSNYNPGNEYRFITIVLDIYDSAEIPMMRYKFGNAFLVGMNGLELATNNNFREARTIDLQFTFNRLDVEFIIPGFKMPVMTINLR